MSFKELNYLNDYELSVKMLDMVNVLRSHFQMSDKTITILTKIPQNEMKNISCFNVAGSKKEYILRLYDLFQMLVKFEKESNTDTCK